jgi:mycothiol system anti-sigma-R factor
MNCEEVIRLRDGYLDGELDPVTNEVIEEHLQTCRNCAEAYQSHRALIGAIQNAASYYNAPQGLRERIRSSLREANSLQPTSLARKVVKPTVFPAIRWNLFAMAAAIALAAVVAMTVVSRDHRTDSGQFLATELIASHVRSLMANHIADVASSDQHTVKPWLDAKLDFAPPVVDLATDGFPLLGGRLDYLDKRPVAALVYKRREHFINLFVWPANASSDDGAKSMSRQGYQLLHWTAADMNYWAVSDVNAEDLHVFQEQFIARTAPH